MNAQDLFNRNQALVYHLIHRTVYDKGAHQDLFQEVFVQALKSLSRFRGEAKLSTWISSITLNTCYSYLKKQTKGSDKMPLDQWLEQRGDFPSPNPAPVEICEQGELRSRIEAALADLVYKYKIPLVLFYFENFSYRQIAETMNIPLNTVKTYLYRGLKQIKMRLGGDIHEFL